MATFTTIGNLQHERKRSALQYARRARKMLGNEIKSLCVRISRSNPNITVHFGERNARKYTVARRRFESKEIAIVPE